MASETVFLVENDTDEDFDIYVEPECFLVRLEHGERVTVRDSYESAPVTVRIGKGESGERVLSLWPGDGDVVVEKNGINVMDGT